MDKNMNTGVSRLILLLAVMVAAAAAAYLLTTVWGPIVGGEAGWASLRCTPEGTGYTDEDIAPPLTATANLSLDANNPSPPIIAHGKIYATAGDKLYCFNLKSPGAEWVKKLPSAPVQVPIYVEDTVIVPLINGELVAYSTRGEEKWRTSLYAPVSAPPISYNGKVYVYTENNVLYQINPENGTANPINRLGFKASSPTSIHQETLLIGSKDFNLYAIDLKTGQIKWTHKCKDTIVSSPACSENTVYYGSLDGAFHALDITDGASRWTYQTSGNIIASPAIDQQKVYICTGKNLYALDKKTGNPTWSYSLLDQPGLKISTSPTICKQTLYICLNNGTLIAVNTENGKQLWKHNINTQPTQTIAAAQGKIAITTRKGNLIILTTTKTTGKTTTALLLAGCTTAAITAYIIRRKRRLPPETIQMLKMLEQRYKEGKISRETYQQLKKKLKERKH